MIFHSDVRKLSHVGTALMTVYAPGQAAPQRTASEEAAAHYQHDLYTASALAVDDLRQLRSACHSPGGFSAWAPPDLTVMGTGKDPAGAR